MVRREQLINKLRSIGYSFKREAWRVQFFKKGTHRPAIPKRDILDDETAASILRQCKVSADDIASFLRNCKN
jgi:hypothetical protein